MTPSCKAAWAASALSMCALITPAGATPVADLVDPVDTTITFGQTPSPCPSGFICNVSSLSFVHDITDDGFTIGDSITAATLAIHLTDPAGGGSESYEFAVGGSQVFASMNVPSGGGGSVDTFFLTMPSLQDLSVDGKIAVAVKSLGGSFAFADSLFTVNDPPGPPLSPLPEPGTLALFGIVLAGGASRTLMSKARAAFSKFRSKLRSERSEHRIGPA